jgi:hypothetical protein
VYELTIDIEDCNADQDVTVRAWVDHLESADLTTETELSLSKIGGTQWKGTFSFSDVDADYNAFLYRVGVVANPGANWALCIRRCDEGELSSTLLEDADVLVSRKEWLLGTCDAQG